MRGISIIYCNKMYRPSRPSRRTVASVAFMRCSYMRFEPRLPRPLFDVPVVGVPAVPGPVQDARVPVPQSRQVGFDGGVVPLAEPDHRTRRRSAAAEVPHHVSLGVSVQGQGSDAECRRNEQRRNDDCPKPPSQSHGCGRR